MTSHDFHEKKKDADRYNAVWMDYFTKKFPTHRVERAQIQLDVNGYDFILIDKRNHKIFIDVKVSYWREDYPIETMSNCEKKQDGWAYTNTNFIGMVHVLNGVFVDEPVIFHCTDIFRKRVARNSHKFFLPFKTTTPHSDGTHHTTVGWAVPRRWLENFENEVWFERQTGENKQHKLGEF
jgi:hypothetical protein